MPTRAAEFQAAQVFSRDQVLLHDLSFEAFTFPGDQEALAALKRVPGAPALLTYLQENFTEQMIFVENNEQMLRAGPRSFASLYKLVTRCSEILSLQVPDVYVTNNPSMNAYTVGHSKTCVVLNSGLIEGLTADELSFVVGHELGHIKCGHGLYRQLGDLLLKYWDAVASQIPVPGVTLLRIPLLMAYWEWYRRAEFTCDRAGLLCVQSMSPCLLALAKLAGKVHGFEDEIDVESAIAQNHAHKEVNKLVLVISILEQLENTHPFVPARLQQLKAYGESPEYRRVVSGDYKRDFLGRHEGGVRVVCQCGLKVNSKLRHCPNCGRLVVSALPVRHSETATCEACGRAIGPQTKWCTVCGAEQKNSTPAQQPVSGLDKIKSGLGFGKRS